MTLESSLIHQPEAVKKPGNLRLEISGSQGYLDIDLIPEPDPVPSELERDEPAMTPTYRMLGNFVEAIQGRARIAAAGMDGLRTVEVVETARRAWEFRTVVAL